MPIPLSSTCTTYVPPSSWAWTRTEPWNVTAETGYMIGAAGVGSAFLHLHLAEQGKYQAILFPDNPFPSN